MYVEPLLGNDDAQNSSTNQTNHGNPNTECSHPVNPLKTDFLFKILYVTSARTSQETYTIMQEEL